MEMIGAKAYNSIEQFVSISFLLCWWISIYFFVRCCNCNKHTISHFHFVENTKKHWVQWKTIWNGVSNKQCHERRGKKWQIYRNGNEKKRRERKKEMVLRRTRTESPEIIVETHPKWQKIYVRRLRYLLNYAWTI